MKKRCVLYAGFLGVAVLLASCASSSGAVLTASVPAVAANETAPRPSIIVSSEPRLYRMTGDPAYKSPRNVTIDAASLSNQMTGLATDWYRDAAFYHVWVKAFSDYDGDGVGDFRGITAKLDYIKDDLGCDAIWLSPIFDCAYKDSSVQNNMHGYDTVDYYSVNDYLGNEEQLETLLAEAHKRGIKVIFDFVPNHTSSQHPWFINSTKAEDGKKDWYLWNDERLSWNPMGSSSTWYFNVFRQAYYYGAFNAGMPDLNFRNYEVREEMKNVARYWLNKGFDGMRIDAVRYLAENGGTGGQIDQEETHEFFRELRRDVIDRYAALGSPKFMVSEAWVNGDRSRLARYFGTAEKPEFNMAFNFDFSGMVTVAAKYRNAGVFDEVRHWRNLESGGNPGRIAYFLSNHDNIASRPGSAYTESQLRLATAMELLVPGTPFIYYANEIGQKNAAGYSGEDIRLRYPLDWTVAAEQKGQPDSLLNLHKALLAARRAYPAIRRGTIADVPSSVPDQNPEAPFDTKAVTLSLDGKSVLCVYNLAAREQAEVTVSLPDALKTKKAGSIIGKARASVASDGRTVTVSGLGPNGFAVYILGEDVRENFWPY